MTIPGTFTDEEMAACPHCGGPLTWPPQRNSTRLVEYDNRPYCTNADCVACIKTTDRMRFPLIVVLLSAGFMLAVYGLFHLLRMFARTLF